MNYTPGPALVAMDHFRITLKGKQAHTPTFAADDASVPIGMRTMANLIMDYLKMESGLAP